MIKLASFIEKTYFLVFSENVRKKIEHYISAIAIIGFLLHIFLIFLYNQKIIHIDHDKTGLFDNPGMVLYTPFSIILIYEIYLLIYYLPKSTSNYICKQYEIITLIVVRRTFKDISKLDLNSNWIESTYNMQFTYDVITVLVLFGMLYLFHKLNRTYQKKEVKSSEFSKSLQIFVLRKKMLGIILLPIFVIMTLYSVGMFLYTDFIEISNSTFKFKDINSIFFHEFFTILILADVLLLLLSFYYTDVFYTVVRNSGFLISTILIRLSFSTMGIQSNVLIISALLFGLLILFIYSKYELIFEPNRR